MLGFVQVRNERFWAFKLHAAVCVLESKEWDVFMYIISAHMAFCFCFVLLVSAGILYLLWGKGWWGVCIIFEVYMDSLPTLFKLFIVYWQIWLWHLWFCNPSWFWISCTGEWYRFINFYLCVDRWKWKRNAKCRSLCCWSVWTPAAHQVWRKGAGRKPQPHQPLQVHQSNPSHQSWPRRDGEFSAPWTIFIPCMTSWPR